MPIAAEKTPIFFRSKEPPPIFFRSKKPHHPPLPMPIATEKTPIFFRSKKPHHPPLPMPIAAEKTQPDATDGGLRSTLSPEQLRSFHTNGYLVIESFSEEGEIEEMMGRMRHLLEGFDSSASSSIFSAKNQQKFTDNFFFESAENISFFFEEGAFGSDGRLKHPKELSINKVGHALHELDPIFKKFSQSSKMSGLLFSLGYERPLIIQSMYIFKQPGIGGEVVPHQDNSFLYTDPPSCTGLWLALEDAMVSNGCLWALPGSHKNGLVRRFLRDENGVHFDHPSPSYDRNDFIPLEVKAGSLVILHGDLIHQSFENQSPKSRHAYTVHAVDSEGCKWANDNWIRRKTEARPLYEVEPASSRDDRSR